MKKKTEAKAAVTGTNAPATEAAVPEAKAKYSKKKEILIPTLSLFLIALISTFLLAIVNNLTADKIAAATAASEEEARQSVFADADNFVEKSYTFTAKDKDGTALGKQTYYEATDKSGNVIGYVFNNGYKGYGGTVTCTVGVDIDGSVTGVVPGDLSNETPGLGQTATKPSFLKQFVGADSTLTLVKTTPANKGEVKALTSATITSTAVTTDVNDALAEYAELSGGGK